MLKTIIYYLKFLFIYFTTTIRQYISSTSTTGFGKRKVFTNYEKENVRKPIDGFSIDASYFNGFDFNGNFFGFGMQKRPNSRCESVFFVRIKDFSDEPLVLNINPSTWVKHNPTEWSTDVGLKFKMLIPMKRWGVEYNGDVVEMYSRKLHKMKLSFIWDAYPAIYDADKDMDKITIARAIAKEKWSKVFFDNLKKLHQTHYELFGQTTSFEIEINDNYKVSDLCLISMKDRSYGIHRNWGDFRRYILHYLGTKDGIFIGCHFVSITKTFSHLLVGFVMDKDGNKVSIRYCNKTLFDIGENEVPLNEKYNYELIDVNGKKYLVNIQVKKYVKFYCGENQDGTLFSAYVSGDINKSPAVGMCEYEYNSEMFKNILI